MAGRAPFELTEANKTALLKAFGQNLKYKDAATMAGLSGRSFHRWKAAAIRSKSGPDWQFWQQLQQERIKLKSELIGNVKRAAKKDWRAAARLLEVMWPEEFSSSKNEIKALETQLADAFQRIGHLERTNADPAGEVAPKPEPPTVRPGTEPDPAAEG